jgi:hypothetical protein
MPQKRWTVPLEDGPHTISLDRSAWTGRGTVRLDNEPVPLPSNNLFDLYRVIPVPLPGHDVAVHIRSNGLTYADDLVVDGRSVQTGRAVATPLPLPGWAWIFIAACGSILCVFLGGLIPAVCAFGGAAICAALARDASRPTNIRVALCLAVTVLAWLLAVFFLYGLALLQS